MKKQELQKIFINPFYAIKIEETFCKEHEFIVTEEAWIETNIKLIKEIGEEKYLKMLLDVLKGNYI